MQHRVERTSDQVGVAAFAVAMSVAISFASVSSAGAADGAPASGPTPAVATTSPAAKASREVAVADADFDAALDAALEHYQRRSPVEFYDALKPVMSRFPVAEPALKPGGTPWQELTLNQRGRRIDAVRFRVPAGVPRDLFWSYVRPPKMMQQWNIVAAHRVHQTGFRTFWEMTAIDVLGKTAKPTIPAFIQPLPAALLEPGGEYLIYFIFKDERPVTFWLTLALLPERQGQPSTEDAAAALGLPRPLSPEQELNLAAQPKERGAKAPPSPTTTSN